MKKSLLLFATLLIGIIGLQSQSYIFVTGTVTDEDDGSPVPNHIVDISVDSIYYNTVYTNNTGLYMDTIISNQFIDQIWIATPDLCTFLVHDTIVNAPPAGAVVVADFEICTEMGGNDCQADFSYGTNPSNPYLISFYDESTPVNAIDNWYWNFGDGSTSFDQNPIHAYNAPGAFDVCLTISTFDPVIGDSCVSIYCEEIIVGDSTGSGCQADFSYTSSPANDFIISFIDESTPVDEIDYWYWDFGDGNFSNEQNPTHTYNAFGSFDVCLTIMTSYPDSCISTYCENITIGNAPECQAMFTYYPDSLNQNMIQFVDQSTPANAIDSWFWEFGDGTTSSEQNPMHAYNSFGSFDVCLTIVGYNPAIGDSCVSTYCETIVIGNGGECQAMFNYYPDSLNQNMIQFVDQSTPANAIDSWFWSFGDGSGSSEQNPQHQFGEPGTYPVCLTIMTFDPITADSCISIHCETITIGGFPACEAMFTYNPDSIGSNLTYFIDLSYPQNQINSWYWDFGDGNTSSLQNPIHQFGGAGTYSVCLTITAYDGADTCSSTYCEDIVFNGAEFVLGGHVFAGIYLLDEGFAHSYKVENGSFTEINSQIIDTLGYYVFYVPAGDYYAKVEPTPNSAYFGNYLPTYYGDVVHWEDAQLINLNQHIYSAEINLVEMTTAQPGDGLISGYIYYQGNEKDGNPAVDIQIMLANANNEMIGMVLSDENGYYEFTNLANGTYTLYAEIMGISITPKILYLSDDNQQIENLTMTIGEDYIVFSVNELNSNFISSISELYPNPANQELNFDVEVTEPSVLQINIVSLTGQVLMQIERNLGHSEQVRINTSGLQPGIYLLQVITEDNIQTTQRFIRY